MPLPSDTRELLERARSGDRRSLGRLISIVEDGRPGADDILSATYPMGGVAHVVGITGSPGAGKSTLVDRLIGRYRSGGAEVAVVAVDPSSPFTGGALLGDRVRMQDHASDRGVYVRSMSSRGHLGGLADASAKVVAVLDAVGFDPVIVETVGVGQSEVEVAELADTVLVVVTPGMGDGIQAAKAGLLEVGDLFVVNKADRPGADEVARELSQMLELGHRGDWAPEIVSCSAITGEGVADVIAAIGRHQEHLRAEGRLGRRRIEQARRLIDRAVLAHVATQMRSLAIEAGVLDAVASRRLDPWSAAERMRGKLRLPPPIR
jgi:LAO/AO transport system kinase